MKWQLEIGADRGKQAYPTVCLYFSSLRQFKSQSLNFIINWEHDSDNDTSPGQ